MLHKDGKSSWNKIVHNLRTIQVTMAAWARQRKYFNVRVYTCVNNFGIQVAYAFILYARLHMSLKKKTSIYSYLSISKLVTQERTILHAHAK